MLDEFPDPPLLILDMTAAELTQPKGRGLPVSDFIFVRVHAMPCVNRCWHCFCNGSPGGEFMEEDRVLRVLDSLAELKEQAGNIIFPMFYDEPTLHPAFKRIMIHQLEKDLIFDDWWLSTNGYGLARMSDDDWEELAEAGFNFIRLTFHGIGDDHDRLVGRKGAYQDMVVTILKAEEHNVQWLAGMVLNPENQSMYEATRDTVESLGNPCTGFGWMLPQSGGRALEGDNRVTIREIDRLLEGKKGWVTEGEYVRRILSEPDLGDRSARSSCGITYLDIEQDLGVYYGGGCDGDPFGFMKDQLQLGNMEAEGISACLDKYYREPPEPVRILSGVTWAELARKYGDPDSDSVYHHTDLTGRKWAESYLRDHYGTD